MAAYTNAIDLDDGDLHAWSDDLTWSEGADASDFNIGNQDEGTTFGGVLTFKEMPPTTRSPRTPTRTTYYRVTVEVFRRQAQTGHPGRDRHRSPTWKKKGKVTLSSVQPKVAIPI